MRACARRDEAEGSAEGRMPQVRCGNQGRGLALVPSHQIEAFKAFVELGQVKDAPGWTLPRKTGVDLRVAESQPREVVLFKKYSRTGRRLDRSPARRQLVWRSRH